MKICLDAIRSTITKEIYGYEEIINRKEKKEIDVGENDAVKHKT